jgi:hypothetical protein
MAFANTKNGSDIRTWIRSQTPGSDQKGLDATGSGSESATLLYRYLFGNSDNGGKCAILSLKCALLLLNTKTLWGLKKRDASMTQILPSSRQQSFSFF